MNSPMKIQIDDYGEIINLYNDKSMRDGYCKMLSSVFGGTFLSNPKAKDTDIYWLEMKEFFEGESGDSWDGNREKNTYHRDRFGVGFYCINGPERKLPSLCGVRAENRPDLDWMIEFYKKRTIHFIRGNNDRTQIFIVRSKILRDPSKWTLAKPDYAVSTATRPEHWFCVPAELCEIYNLKLDGRYILSTEPDGNYMTEAEHEIFKQRQRLYAAKVRHEYLNNLKQQ